MYIESVPNRDSPPAILLRESFREGGKVKKRTLLNISDWPRERIAGFKALLKGGTVIPADQEAISIVRSLPHGAVAAALGTARKIGLDRLIGPDGDRCRDLVLALAVSRILDPGSKLAAARALSPETAASSLGVELGLGPVDEDELYPDFTNWRRFLRFSSGFVTASHWSRCVSLAGNGCSADQVPCEARDAARVCGHVSAPQGSSERRQGAPLLEHRGKPPGIWRSDGAAPRAVSGRDQ